MQYWQLKQLTSLPLDIKILKTKQRIREWYQEFDGKVYISFSGGKDSTVLLNLVREEYPDVEAVFFDTGLEYPEIRDFVSTIENVTWIKPNKSFKTIIEEYGYPVIGKKQARFIRDLQNASENNTATVNLRLTGLNRKGDFCPSQKLAKKWLFMKDAPFKVSEKCCDVMKKNPAKQYANKTGNHPIIATMASESNLREKSWLDHGCNMYDSSTPMSRPMSFWKDSDVLEYLFINNIEIAECYGDIEQNVEDDIIKYNTTGEKRTGCMFCMFGVHLEKHPNRFERMKETHPIQYRYCMDVLGISEVLDYINVDY